jgi:DNA helicase-2/ATP-dependent DNA helicase PcrA
MKELHNGNSPEERSKYENLDELLNGIRDFVDSAREEDQPFTLPYYLENIALLTDVDNEKEEDRNKVSIMTIHSAKGLEFSYVYIAGVEEELFPSRMSLDSVRDLEEERRLFYVAVTRAKVNVTISYSQSRYKWGVPAYCNPSRFIRDIADDFIEWPDDPRKDKQKAGSSYQIRKQHPSFESKKEEFPLHDPNKKLSRIDNSAKSGIQQNISYDSDFQPSDPVIIQSGMFVEHQRFGRGEVINIEGDFPNKKATVFFQQIKQEKQLLLKFAKLRIVDNL